MRKINTILMAMAATLCSNAQINCQPGSLSHLVSDTNITQLTVTGKMDARDFKFIADKLNKLEKLDLAGVEITAYQELTESTLGNVYTFQAATVPTMALAGMPMLKSVTLPASAHTIATAAMAGCPNLTSVTLPASVQVIGDYALSGNTALETITLPASVTSVGQGTFSHCTALAGVAISTTGTAAASLTIGDEAFLGCEALKNVNLGQNVTAIGNSAFAGTGLTVVDLSQYKKLQSMGKWAYALSNVTSATLPSTGVMGAGAFIYSDKLQSAVLPAGLQELAEYTFAGNSALQTLDMGNITKIGRYALYQASAIQETTIPQRVTFIDDMAMAGMAALKALKAAPASVPALGQDIWAGVDQKTVRLVVDPQRVNDYANAAQWKEFIISLAALRGDADKDNAISVGDVNEMTNVFLGYKTTFAPQADTNEDGLITIEDINYDINVLLHREPESYIYIDANTTDLVSIQDFSIAPGETREIDIVLDNDQLCAHMQCDINLPDGLTVVDARCAQRAASHTLIADTQDGSCRVICYSTRGQAIDGNSGAVVTLTVKADENLASETTITVNNVVLAGGDHTLYAQATETAVNNTTGIDQLKDRQVQSVRYYNVAGIEAATPHDGINIVVTTYTDGTTDSRKVIK